MGKTTKACLNTAQNNGGILIGLPDQIAVDNHSVIRAKTGFSSRRIGILLPSFSGNRIVIYHGIHVSCRNQKSQTGFSEFRHTAFILPVRLGQNADTIAPAFEHSADDRRPKGGMIHIGIPGNVYKIRLFPAPFLHFFSRDGQKSLHINPHMYQSAHPQKNGCNNRHTSFFQTSDIHCNGLLLHRPASLPFFPL